MSSSFLIVPLKKTQAVDFIKPISSYIKNSFSTEVLNENKDSLAELNQLRGNAVVRSLDKHETSLETLQRYYDQISNMEAKLPISENQIRVSLTWYDAFDKGSIFGSTKCSLSSGSYEKFCVLFNISGLLSQIACSQNLTTDDGLKTAAKYYQQSAGILAYLKDNVYPVLQTLPTPDLSVSCLATLSAIMVAQAQDCFFIKAKSDNMKEALLAKIAMQAADHYQEAHRAATFYEVKGLWDKEWIPSLQCKYSYFVAVAEMYHASTAVATGKYGEQVARLQKASKYIADAIKQGGQYTPANVKTTEGEINRLYASAKKDNELIYLDSIPKLDALTAIQRAAIAKPTPFTSPMSSNFKDLFTKLVPVEVMQGLSAYESAKNAVVGSERMKLGEATQFLNGVLASLNLPAAIEDLTGQSCPQSLKDKANEIKEKGGLSSIDQMMENLPDLLNRNREIIDETFRMLDEEERDDTQMREHFKERWSRTPSNKLTQQLREEGNKYRGILDTATNADSIVKSKYDANRRSLEILSKGGDEIASQLPKCEVHLSGTGAEVVQELRGYMTEVEQLKKQRDELTESLKSATVDMQSKFLQALAAEGLLDTERITNENIDTLYADIRTSIAENITNQEQLVEKIQRANEQFNAAKQSSGSVNPRDQMLKELATAYDEFIALSANLTEGSKFYNDLTQILLKYQSKVEDFVFARKTEKDDLSKDLQQQAAKGTGAAAPPAPTHHQETKPTPQARPDRPPPPMVRQAPPPQPQPRQAPNPNWQQNQPPPGGQPYQPQQPYAPAAASGTVPYPTQPGVMPYPAYYAPPAGGYYAPPQPYFPPAPQSYGQYPQQGQYIPPYAQQPPMGYQGYPGQQPRPQR